MFTKTADHIVYKIMSNELTRTADYIIFFIVSNNQSEITQPQRSSSLRDRKRGLRGLSRHKFRSRFVPNDWTELVVDR